MIFDEIPLETAEGAILAHTHRGASGTVKKGTRLSAADVERLAADGLERVVAAVLAPDDVHEDEAAARLAAAVAGPGVMVAEAFTGRANLFADGAGVLLVDREAVDGLNRIDPSLTIATLEAFRRVEAGRMVATVKIIPFAVAPEAMAAAERHLAASGPAVRLAPFRVRRVAAVSTLLPVLKTATVDKTVRILGERLAGTGAEVSADERVAHETRALADALARLAAGPDEVIVVFGASAVVDRRDVIPAAVEAAGGTVHHFGMPVDPGNLLLVGEVAGKPVIGAPGCARSPKENGFDWVLDRFLAHLPVTARDITGMGVGGLLMEIVSRPQPRAEPAPEDRAGGKTAAVVLAAGKSSRMGARNKLLIDIDGKPMVRHAVEAALKSRASPVVVVTGHDAEAVTEAIADLPVTIRHNPRFAEGLSTSLATGIGALPEDVAAAVVLLGDMPQVSAADVDRLIETHEGDAAAHVVLSTVRGKRGNPVLWSSRFFAELMEISGDTGGRVLFEAYPEAVAEVEIGAAARADIDTPEALRAFLDGLGRDAGTETDGPGRP